MSRMARLPRQCQRALCCLGGVDHFAQVPLLVRGQQQRAGLSHLVLDGARRGGEKGGRWRAKGGEVRTEHGEARPELGGLKGQEEGARR